MLVSQSAVPCAAVSVSPDVTTAKTLDQKHVLERFVGLSGEQHTCTYSGTVRDLTICLYYDASFFIISYKLFWTGYETCCDGTK